MHQLLEQRHKIHEVTINRVFREENINIEAKEREPDQPDIINQQQSQEDDKLSREHCDGVTLT